MAKFYAHELVLGQVNLLFAVVVMIAVVQLRRGREVMAGVLLGACRRRQAVRGALRAVARGPAAERGICRDAGRPSGPRSSLPAVRYGWAGNLHLLGDWWTTVTDVHGAQPAESGQRVAGGDVHEMAGARFGGADADAAGDRTARWG